MNNLSKWIGDKAKILFLRVNLQLLIVLLKQVFFEFDFKKLGCRFWNFIWGYRFIFWNLDTLYNFVIDWFYIDVCINVLNEHW